MQSIRTRILRAFIVIYLLLLTGSIVLLVGHTTLVNEYDKVVGVMSDQYQLNQSVSRLITTYNDLVRSNSPDVSPDNPTIKTLERQISAQTTSLDSEVVDSNAKASFVGLSNSIQAVVREINTGLDEFTKGQATSTEHYSKANRDYVFVQSNSVTFTFDQLQYINAIKQKLHNNYRLLEIGAVIMLVILAIGSFLYSLRFAGRIVAPLKQLTKIAEQIAADKMEVTIPPALLNVPDETGSLASSFNTMFMRLKEKIRELHEAKASVEKQVQERTYQLHAEQAKLLASIQSLPTGFALADTQGKLVAQNNNLQQIFGLSASPQSLQDLGVNIQSLNLVDKFNAVLQSKQYFEVQEMSVNARIVRLFMGPVTVVEGNAEEVIGVVITSEDVTEAKNLERSKDEFFSIASHELRTPLTAIRGNTKMIINYFSEQLKDPNLKEMVDDIHKSSVRLIEIVNDFLDLSRLEQGKMDFKTQAFAINEVIGSVADEMKTVLEENKLDLRFESAAEGEPLRVLADPNRTKQIVYNLLGNAAKFTEHGGITISTVLEKGFVKVLVSDTGRGISPEGQMLLFHKFQQAGDSLLTRDTTRGTGLGLYISKALAEKMGGQLALEHSELGKGSTFSFMLPVAPES